MIFIRIAIYCMTVFFYSCTVLADDVSQKLAEIQQNIVLGNWREAKTQLQVLDSITASQGDIYTVTAIKGLQGYLKLQNYSTIARKDYDSKDENSIPTQEVFNYGQKLLTEALNEANSHSWIDLSARFSLYLGQMNEELARQNEQDKKKYLTEAQNNYLLVKNYAAQVTDKSLIVSSLCSLAKLDIENKEFNEGWKILQQAKAELENLTISKELASQLWLSIGYQNLQLYLQNPTQNKYLAETNGILNKSLTLARENNQIINQALSLNYLAQLYTQQNRQQEAKKLLLEAVALLNPLKIAQENNVLQVDDVLFDIYKQLSEIYKNEHSLYEELVVSREAIKYLERIRFDIPIMDKNGKSSFKEIFSPLYVRFADLLLQQAAKTVDKQQNKILLTEARDAIELMKKTEMEDYIKSRCRPAVPIDLKSKDPDAAVIYPIILADRLEIIVNIANENEKTDNLYQITQRIKAVDLEKTVESFYKHLHNYDPFYNKQSQEQSEFIYSNIITPIKTTLEKEKIKTLIYVPDGVLRLIPLAGLYDGKKFLIEDYAVVTSVGMTLIENDSAQYHNQDILLAGTSKTKDKSYKDLPGVQTEIKDLAKQHNVTDFLLDENFLLERFEKKIKSDPHKYLFIASHGFFGETEEDSFVLTYEGRLNIKRLKNILSDDYFKKHPIDLITLSACDTAKGSEKIPLGLSGMAIKSKVHSALGSLWKVPDDETKEIMLDFYKILKENPKDKAKALQQAQTNYLTKYRNHAPQKISPFKWAAFILVGDWQ